MRRVLLAGLLALVFACHRAPRPLDRSGEAVDLTANDGVTVMHFWGSWCGPCQQELPQFASFVAHHRGTRIASVAVEQNWNGVDRFLRERSISLTNVYLDPGGHYSQAFGIEVIPTTLVFNKRGEIVERIRGPADWSSSELEQQISAAAH